MQQNVRYALFCWAYNFKCEKIAAKGFLKIVVFRATWLSGSHHVTWPHTLCKLKCTVGVNNDCIFPSRFYAYFQLMHTVVPMGYGGRSSSARTMHSGQNRPAQTFRHTEQSYLVHRKGICKMWFMPSRWTEILNMWSSQPQRTPSMSLTMRPSLQAQKNHLPSTSDYQVQCVRLYTRYWCVGLLGIED